MAVQTGLSLGYYKHLCFPVFAPWEDKKGLHTTKVAAAKSLKSFLTVYVSFRGNGGRFESGNVLFNLSGCDENRQSLFFSHVSTYRLHSQCISSERAKLPFLSTLNCSEYAFVSEIPSSPRLAKAAHFPYRGRSPRLTCPSFQVCFHL